MNSKFNWYCEGDLEGWNVDTENGKYIADITDDMYHLYVYEDYRTEEPITENICHWEDEDYRQKIEAEIMKHELINKIEYVQIAEHDIRNSNYLNCFTSWFDSKWEEFEDDPDNLTDERWRTEGYIVEFIFRENYIETLAGVTTK